VESLTIGKISRLTGVGIEAIRFYEREGLLAEPPRRESGYRNYSEDAILQLRFIRAAKELGFSLKEIKELLSLRIDPRANCGDIQKRAQAKVTEIEKRMWALEKMRRVLTQLARACPGRGPLRDCSILEGLDDAREPRAVVRPKRPGKGKPSHNNITRIRRTEYERQTQD